MGDILNHNRDVFRDHFDYEQAQFEHCGVGCDADGHTKKHDVFFRTLTWVSVPLSTEYIEWGANWLAQHIINTDFGYKHKFLTHHHVPEPYVGNEEFKVFFPTLDNEHVGLFEGMLAVEHDLGNEDKLNHLKKAVRDHFYYEEEKFCNGDEDLPSDYCPRHKYKHAKFSGNWPHFMPPSSSMTLSGLKTGWSNTSRTPTLDTSAISSTTCPSPMSGTTLSLSTTPGWTPNTMYCSPTSSPCHSIPTTLPPWLFSRRM